jgi:hypothetical protein
MTAYVRTREWASTDYYAELGVPRSAPGGVIDDAFRRIAKEHHPDRSASPESERRFRRALDAYKILRDPTTRAAYDTYRRSLAGGAAPWYDEAWRGGEADDWAPVPSPRAIPRERRPMPPWMRRAIAAVLAVAALLAGAWAAFGALPSNSAGDSSVAVQITLGIVAVKLFVGAAIVLAYPQLRARWHH